jgi:hypothetical protein
MTTTLTTLNISVEQIESDLRRGRTVQEIAQDWSEPAANVLAVKRAMDARTNAPAPAAGTSAPVVAPVRQVPAPTAAATSSTLLGHRVDESAITVDAIVAAAARSTSKRTQVLGVKLADLAKVVRERLADERKSAEAAEAKRAEQERAAAEVKRLEAALREARAKLRGPKRQGGVRAMPSRPEKSTAAAGALICGKGCGRMFSRPAWLTKHETTCGGAS